jgi:hypothetical protein
MSTFVAMLLPSLAIAAGGFIVILIALKLEGKYNA